MSPDKSDLIQESFLLCFGDSSLPPNPRYYSFNVGLYAAWLLWTRSAHSWTGSQDFVSNACIALGRFLINLQELFLPGSYNWNAARPACASEARPAWGQKITHWKARHRSRDLWTVCVQTVSAKQLATACLPEPGAPWGLQSGGLGARHTRERSYNFAARIIEPPESRATYFSDDSILASICCCLPSSDNNQAAFSTPGSCCSLKPPH